MCCSRPCYFPSVSCNHKGGPELIEMAEAYLRERQVPSDAWNGLKFRWAENVDGMWASVIVEAERRGDQWVVTRLDRRKESLDPGETGFFQLELG